MNRYISAPNGLYLIAFIILSTIYLFLSFLYSSQPTNIRMANFFISFFVTVFIYGFYLLIFLAAARMTAVILRKIVNGASLEGDLPETFLFANLLFIFLFPIYLDAYIKANRAPGGEIMMTGLLYYTVPFFTSLIGGILSGCLVLLSEWDSRQVIKVGKIVSTAAVLLFFAYNFLTIRL